MLRYEIRTYGWKNGKPFNRTVEKTNDFEKVSQYLVRSDMYAIDNQKNMVIEEILINNLCIACV